MFTKPIDEVENLESYFNYFRNNILGIDQSFESPYGTQKIVYVDWTASGRLYVPIEKKVQDCFGPYVANTHTETTVTGTTMTQAYQKAKQIIKNHVHANEHDVLLNCGTGMTGVINKFQRILGYKIPEQYKNDVYIREEDRPVVFISHMEHHSNHTSWLETIAKVVIVPCDSDGLFCMNEFTKAVANYKTNGVKIASITGCSNVTGIKTPYHEVAKLMHKYNGLCFVDFACSAPYIEIDMHPNEQESLDAIFFSPHKFLGGPGSSGVLLFNKKLYNNQVPDNPGGGTVTWTNPWGNHKYIDDVEEREDGGTPGFMQVIRTSLAIKLKEQMRVSHIIAREKELISYVFDNLETHQKIKILASEHRDRLGVFSFLIEDLHHELAVRILNDRFGIQSRGGCSCAGTYGHFLLDIDEQTSTEIVKKIETGNCTIKPGWIRISVHPTTSNQEVEYVCNSIVALADNHSEWSKEYRQEGDRFFHDTENKEISSALKEAWFEF